MKAKQNQKKINIRRLALQYDQAMKRNAEAQHKKQIEEKAKAYKVLIIDALKPQLKSGFKDLKASKGLKNLTLDNMRKLLPKDEKEIIWFNQATAPGYIEQEYIDQKKKSRKQKIKAGKGGARMTDENIKSEFLRQKRDDKTLTWYKANLWLMGQCKYNDPSPAYKRTRKILGLREAFDQIK